MPFSLCLQTLRLQRSKRLTTVFYSHRTRTNMFLARHSMPSTSDSSKRRFILSMTPSFEICMMLQGTTMARSLVRAQHR